MSITDKSAEADFFVAFSRQYKLSAPKTCISQKILVPLHAECVQQTTATDNNKQLRYGNNHLYLSTQR